MVKKFAVGLIVNMALIGPGTNAQEINLHELQINIEAFSVVIEEALELDRGAGLFGMTVGGVEPTYLYGQGVLLEVRTPLANQRNRLNLVSLNSAMRTLQDGNPFERLMRRTTTSVAATEPRYEVADSFNRKMMERITKIDYSLVVSTAIQQAADSARSLRALGDIDDAGYEELRIELEGMRESMNENLSRLREVEEELIEVSEMRNGNSDNSSVLDIESRLNDLMESLEPLRTLALAKSEELKIRTEIAEQSYIASWQKDVILFEDNLYRTICNYGGTLRALPLLERVSIMLRGLGEEVEGSNRISDKLHVIANNDIQKCQNGSIDFSELRERARQYSF